MVETKDGVILLNGADKERIDEKVKTGVGEPEAEKAPVPFTSSMDNGVLTIRLDLKAAVVNQQYYYVLRGFIEDQKDNAVVFVISERQRLEEQKNKLILDNNKQGFRSFLRNKLH